MYDDDDEYRDHVAMAQRWTHEPECGPVCEYCGMAISLAGYYERGRVCMECAADLWERSMSELRREEQGWTT